MELTWERDVVVWLSIEERKRVEITGDEYPHFSRKLQCHYTDLKVDRQVSRSISRKSPAKIALDHKGGVTL